MQSVELLSLIPLFYLSPNHLYPNSMFLFFTSSITYLACRTHLIFLITLVLSPFFLSEMGCSPLSYFFLFLRGGIGVLSIHCKPLNTRPVTRISAATQKHPQKKFSIYDSVFLSKAFLTSFSPL